MTKEDTFVSAHGVLEDILCLFYTCMKPHKLPTVPVNVFLLRRDSIQVSSVIFSPFLRNFSLTFLYFYMMFLLLF